MLQASLHSIQGSMRHLEVRITFNTRSSVTQMPQNLSCDKHWRMLLSTDTCMSKHFAMNWCFACMFLVEYNAHGLGTNANEHMMYSGKPVQ